ncbi:MAG: nucleotide disphospho-sugar-binding domain-containing protein [Chloroflexota bacterium]
MNNGPLFIVHCSLVMRFLFCPISSHGYVYPAVRVALELRQRGHQVAFATGPAFATTLAQAEFERLPRGPVDGESFSLRLWNYPLEVVRQVKHVEYASRRFAPDVLVASSLAIGPLVAARRHRLPVAVLGLATYIWPLAAVAPAEFQPRTLAEKRAATAFDETLRVYGEVCRILHTPVEGPPATYQNHPLVGDLFLLRSVAELEGNVDELPAQVHLVGDCAWEPATQSEDLAVTTWLEEAVASLEPLLYVQHDSGGGIPDFWPGLVEGLGGEPVRIVGTHRKVSQADGLPANFLIRPHIPYQIVLPHAQAVITAGNSSLSLAAFTQGLPLLLIPVGKNEGESMVERCQRAGVGICRPTQDLERLYPENVSADSLRAAVHEVIGRPDLRQNARRLQRAFQQAGGPPLAAELLERLARVR